MIATRRLTIETRGNGDTLDLTGRLQSELESVGLHAGTVTVFVVGSTAGLTTIEYEPGLVADLAAAFERIAPRGASYAHNARWHDDNGHAHVRASLLGPSLGVPIAGGELLLGTWQQVVLVDFDVRPRRREVVLQFVGEPERT